MMSGRVWFLMNLLFCVLIGQATVESATKTETILFELLNGKYSNSRQDTGPTSSRDRIYTVLCPVRVQAISSNPVLFFLEINSSGTVRARLKSVKEISPNILSLETYNIARPSFYQGYSQVCNRTEIESLRPDEIKHIDGCRTEFQVDGDHVSGGWENCRDTFHGKHTFYVVNADCDTVSVEMPLNAPEQANLLPYRFERISEKFQLIDPPENYTRLCDKKNA